MRALLSLLIFAVLVQCVAALGHASSNLHCLEGGQYSREGDQYMQECEKGTEFCFGRIIKRPNPDLPKSYEDQRGCSDNGGCTEEGCRMVVIPGFAEPAMDCCCKGDYCNIRDSSIFMKL